MSHLLLDEKDAEKFYDNGTPDQRSWMEGLYPNKFKRDICDRIQSLEDVYELVGLDRQERKQLWDGMRNYPHLIHFHQATLITEAYNQGWKPNWDDSSEYKYYPWWNHSGFRLHVVDYHCSASGVGSRLVFRESRFVEDAVKKFPDVYKGYLTFNGK